MTSNRKVVLLIETSSNYGRGLLRGIAKYSRIYGPWLFYNEDGGNDQAWPKLESWDADGIITRDIKKNKKVLELGLPIIFRVDEVPVKEHGDYPCILTDGEAIGQIGAEHLINRGFKYFGFCGESSFWSFERQKSFKKCIIQTSHKIDIFTSKFRGRNYNWAKEQSKLIEWLKSLKKPCGLMACNDKQARHVVEAARVVKIMIPEEIAVLGVDNDEMVCELSNPNISSIALNTEIGGYEAAELLDQLMSGKKVNKKTIKIQPSYVHTRRSTDICAIDDSDVATALSYIYANVCSNVQVDDVAEAAGVSRRVLEKRFRKELKRSVYQEIKRIRVEKMIEMLLETTKSIYEISMDFGMNGPKHFSRIFKQEKGMTPNDFRKSFGLS